MKVDYLVSTSTGEEIACSTFAEARAVARQHKADNPIIDQFEIETADMELTGTYWHYVDGKLIKVA